MFLSYLESANISSELKQSLKDAYALIESDQFNQLGREHFGLNYDKTSAARMAKGKTFQSAGTYEKDNLGKNWVNVKKRDKLTLALAFLDGANDSGKLKDSPIKYEDIKTPEDVEMAINSSNRNKVLFKGAYDYLSQYIPMEDKRRQEILKDTSLNQALNRPDKGNTFKVYRGFHMSVDQFVKCCGGKMPQTEHEILTAFSNTSKMFNSFSWSKASAENFANFDESDDEVSEEPWNAIRFVISGVAAVNDLNYAFLMYLFGKDGKLAERELNLNSDNQIRNMKLEEIRGWRPGMKYGQ